MQADDCRFPRRAAVKPGRLLYFGLVLLAMIGVVLVNSHANAQTCPADGTTIVASFDGTEPTMAPRVFRDGIASACVPAKSFPGTIGGTSLFETFAFQNTGSAACVTATLDTGTCGTAVHLLAYLNSFDPLNLSANYLGDVGSSVSQPFSFTVPTGQTFVMVAQTNFGPTTCDYSLTLSGADCRPAPAAPVLSSRNLFVLTILLASVGVLALRRIGMRSNTRLGLIAFSAVILATATVSPKLASSEDSMSCLKACADSNAQCAKEQCNSAESDADPACLQQCQQAYEECAAACSD